ncbi:META domain-containing protein [Nocardioides sp. SR21]|uniref:META domain-containing protein n=1 Tax=Nocardioides sp. SR21 TaxID=2919501 RepID=UPI001FA9A1F8|nr:META domain-containing protein [Nocardioides sp. SR21]
MRGLVVTAALVLTLAACGSDSDSGSDTAEEPQQLELDGTTFTSTEVTGHELVPDTTISLAFEEGNLSANAGCNTMSAEYEVTDGNVAWSGPAASTMMACSDELTEQDQWLTELLTEGVDAKQDGDTLTLTDVDLEIVLEAQ